MSKHAEHTPPAAAAATPSRAGRLAALVPAPVAAILGRFAKLPLWMRAVASLGMIALIGFAAFYALTGSEEIAEVHVPTLDDALQHLQAGELEEARHIATDLRKKNELSYDERGGPAFILGAAMAREAAESHTPEEQRKRALIAARYLDAAYKQGYAQSQTTEGLMLLGRAWHDAGRYPRALPILMEALKRRPRQMSQLHQLLASSFYRDVNPQFKPALEHLRKYLSDRMLTPEQRQAGWIEQARIQFDAGQTQAAQETLAQIPADSKLRAAANIMHARLVMRSAAETQGEAATKLWEEAIALLRTPPGNDAVSAEAQREGQYLLGICYLQTGDQRAAEKQFSRSRSMNVGLPEGLASALEEADLYRQHGQREAALEAYRNLLRDLGDLHDYSNPWLPLDKLRQRLLDAQRYYAQQGEYDTALDFARSLAPLLSEQRILQLQAQVYQSWGEQLAAKAAMEGDDSTKLAAEARAKLHEAADRYYKLSRQSLSSREYPDYLWASAECYRQAQDYHRSVRVLRIFLEQGPAQRRPDALLAIGQAELALGNLESALQSLRQLLRDDPRHPLSYRARLVAHDVLVEQNKFAAARKLLMENVEHESLTPRSLEWRDSLFALGQMLYREGLELEIASREAGVDAADAERRKAGLVELEKSAATMHEAILRLGEAVQRYPNSPPIVEAKYAMAEAYRQAAKLPRKKLPGITIETTRAALQRQMHEELTHAHKLYRELIEDLNARQDQQALAARDREILRNCYFLQADALFDLGKYEEAIAAYSSASNRYQNRPEAVEALLQIASCYRQLDQPAKARGTLEQAKVVLKRIPPEVSFDATTRYSRSEWISLLDFLSTL